MTIALAATWNPRGELPRFRRLLPLFEAVYAGLAVCVPPVADVQALQALREIFAGQAPGGTAEAFVPTQKGLRLVESPVWAWGRSLALQTALIEFPASHIQYADMDRLLRWAETRPEEWRQAVDKIEGCDCLIIGRTLAAYATHPQSLVQTEAISNRVISFLVGREMDVSAGSKGFSRAAAEFILAHCAPGRALGTDGEWPVLAQRGGFRIDYIEVNGLDWESADRYQEQAADQERQRQLAAVIDMDPRNWARRVEVANEIIEAGLEAHQRYLSESTKDTKSTKDEKGSYLLYNDEVYVVIGAAIEVHRQLGSGFLEGVYHEALEIEQTNRGIPFESRKHLTVFYKGIQLKKEYIADFVCYGQIPVEIKAMNRLSGIEEAQLISYLKATGLRVGLLINFGSVGKLEWKRLIV